MMKLVHITRTIKIENKIVCLSSVEKSWVDNGVILGEAIDWQRVE